MRRFLYRLQRRRRQQQPELDLCFHIPTDFIYTHAEHESPTGGTEPCHRRQYGTTSPLQPGTLRDSAQTSTNPAPPGKLLSGGNKPGYPERHDAVRGRKPTTLVSSRAVMSLFGSHIIAKISTFALSPAGLVHLLAYPFSPSSRRLPRVAIRDVCSTQQLLFPAAVLACLLAQSLEAARYREP